MVTLTEPGVLPGKLRAVNSFLDAKTAFDIKVSGHFLCPKCVISLEFGTIKAGQEVCRELKLGGEHDGAVPFEIKLTRGLPSDHQLTLRSEKGRHSPGGPPLAMSPGDHKELCLSTTPSAGASSAVGDEWGNLAAAGRVDPNATVPLKLAWEVQPLSFWERWGTWILIATGILTVLDYLRLYRRIGSHGTGGVVYPIMEI
jgi:hypothetical protein